MIILPLIFLIILTALLNTAAQLLLKTGMEKIGSFHFTMTELLPVVSKVALSPFIITGLLIYVLSVCLWLLVLSRVPVAVAYPMSSLGYIFSAIAAWFLLGEHLSGVQLLGILLIIGGVCLIAPHPA